MFKIVHYLILKLLSFQASPLLKMGEDDDGDSAAAQMAVASPEKVTNYLKRIIPVILEDYDGIEVAALEQAFSDKTGIEALKKFIADPQSRALLVSR